MPLDCLDFGCIETLPIVTKVDPFFEDGLQCGKFELKPGVEPNLNLDNCEIQLDAEPNLYCDSSELQRDVEPKPKLRRSHRRCNKKKPQRGAPRSKKTQIEKLSIPEKSVIGGIDSDYDKAELDPIDINGRQSLTWVPNRCRFESVYRISDFKVYFDVYKQKVVEHELQDTFIKHCQEIKKEAYSVYNKQVRDDKKIVYEEYTKFAARNELKFPTDVSVKASTATTRFCVDGLLVTSMRTTTQLYCDLRTRQHAYPANLIAVRSKILLWMLNQCCVYQCFRSVYFLAVDYFDRYVTCKKIPQGLAFDILGITCIWMATKVVGGYSGYLNVSACANECFENYKEEENNKMLSNKEIKDELKEKIKEMEMEIFTSLDYFVTPITSMEWLEYLLPISNQRGAIVDRAVWLLEACLFHLDIMSFRPDIIARAIVKMSVFDYSYDFDIFDCMKVIHKWRFYLMEGPPIMYTQIDTEELSSCIWQIQTKNKNKDRCIPGKYAFQYPVNDSDHLIVSEMEASLLKYIYKQ
jgi:hypothetical protein